LKKKIYYFLFIFCLLSVFDSRSTLGEDGTFSSPSGPVHNSHGHEPSPYWSPDTVIVLPNEGSFEKILAFQYKIFGVSITTEKGLMDYVRGFMGDHFKGDKSHFQRKTPTDEEVKFFMSWLKIRWDGSNVLIKERPVQHSSAQRNQAETSPTVSPAEILRPFTPRSLAFSEESQYEESQRTEDGAAELARPLHPPLQDGSGRDGAATLRSEEHLVRSHSSGILRGNTGEVISARLDRSPPANILGLLSGTFPNPGAAEGSESDVATLRVTSPLDSDPKRTRFSEEPPLFKKSFSF
jgi:hypothetical protein